MFFVPVCDRVCMTSDFFLEEADPWRAEVWDIMRQRSDVVFFLLTKRPQRVRECLPPEDLYVPHFRANCATCGSRLICNGCSNCGKCL